MIDFTNYGDTECRKRGGFSSLDGDLLYQCLPTKFQVSVSTGYEDMKDDAKCRKGGGFEYLGVIQSH